MFESRSQKKNKIIDRLKEMFCTNFKVSNAETLCTFADRYYYTTPLEEVVGQNIETLYGSTLSCWNHLQKRDIKTPKVRVYNPDLEQHGWSSTHTIIEIVQDDMPFLVDSVRIAIERNGMSIHNSHNTAISVLRSKAGQLKRVLPKDEENGGRTKEALIYLEVDRHTDEEKLKEIKASLIDTLTHVRAVESDGAAIRDRLRESDGPLLMLSGTSSNEDITFVDWLLDGHFVFLGYEEYAIDHQQGLIQQVSGSELGTLRLRSRSSRIKSLDDFSDAARQKLLESTLISFSKSHHRSKVHRNAYQDLIVVKQIGSDGKVIKESLYFGLFTSAVQNVNPKNIPLIRTKVESVLRRSCFEPLGHSYRELGLVIEQFPRDELFLSESNELFETVMGIYNLQERSTVRLFFRVDPCGQFVSFFYYVSRNIFTTKLRQQVQELLSQQFCAVDSEFATRISDSILVRTHFVLRLDPKKPIELNFQALEAQVRKASRYWDDELHNALVDTLGEEQGNTQSNLFKSAFSTAYKENFSPDSAVYDIQHINELVAGKLVSMSFYRVMEQEGAILRFKLFIPGDSLTLSDVIPVLENLGMRVIGEHPYEVKRYDGERYWIHDFTLLSSIAAPVDLQEVKHSFQDAFAAIWAGEAENDGFNRLVIGANISWREVAFLRAYARYCQQLSFGFSQHYIADTLTRHIQLAKLLVALFRARFEPNRQGSEKVAALAERIESSIIDALDKVDNLTEDQILRRFLELIKATLRTSYFQRDEAGELKDYFSFKLNPRAIAGIPLPCPMFEVFVYSARIEGVHLRGGKVARGGLRWSDRLEDYRTEVLGLVKAQQVKNSVIVPVGAKGGFVAKKLPTTGGRDAFHAEGIASYQIFISALLDITDNLVGGEVVPPIDVVRHDEDDPYFVVAADKGTATFSDIANAIAEERGFWLGDAFASGGSQGYDHKGMGITARGAWESVKLHFRELGLDTQSEEFSVIAIGDMAGDVFGNGMLLSEHIQLCAAFNHLHIFIDPNPDAASSFIERKRLFELPRSSWEDYNAELISAGGGIFSRAAKWLDISPQMQTRFGIEEDRLSPNDLLTALLKAPVDLIWNGGIGTYVKASHENHAEVGDKANDSLRINGNQLRCRVLGEGGNLGFTQQGRMEFCANGGKSNTDFIDNAGGVDCSDHEVNIKILLNEVVANGDMTIKQRNALLREMTDEVSELVLQNNYKQAQAISVAHAHCRHSIDEYIRLINRLEDDGLLDRELEFIPADDVLQERKVQQQGLTRPELSVLISYAKAELKEALSETWITDDAYLSREVLTAFPQRLVSDFGREVEQHRLRREIIATQIANGMVNTMGITFVERLCQSSGASLAAVSAAYVIARDVFNIEGLWTEIEALDNQVPSALQQQMMANLIRLIRRAVFWFLRNRRQDMEVADTVAQFRPGVMKIGSMLAELIKGEPRASWQQKHQALIEANVPDGLAGVVAGADSLYSLLSIIQASEQTGQPLEHVAQVYFDLGEQLELHWFDQQVKDIEVSNHWHSMARDGCREDLTSHQQAIAVAVLSCEETADQAESSARTQHWLSQRVPMLQRWQRLLAEIRSSTSNDISIFSVAIRELLELAQAR